MALVCFKVNNLRLIYLWVAASFHPNSHIQRNILCVLLYEAKYGEITRVQVTRELRIKISVRQGQETNKLAHGGHDTLI